MINIPGLAKKNTLNWKPEIDLKEGLTKTITYFKTRTEKPLQQTV